MGILRIVVAGAGKWNRQVEFRALLRRSSQIAAYRRISPRISFRGRWRQPREAPASRHLCHQPVSEMGLIAMQKVEGSNPFSRFTRDPALQRDFVVQGALSENQTTPAYRLHLRH
jgi:hypothetical protein